MATANTSIQPPPVAIVYSDDEGQSWHRARGGSGAAVRVIAFAPEGMRGVAAGDHGTIWSTDDGGVTWRGHGGVEPGACFPQVLVLGIASVLIDERGRIWRSRRGGSQRSLVTQDPEAVVNLRPEAIEIETRGRRYRVLPDGNLQPQ